MKRSIPDNSFDYDIWQGKNEKLIIAAIVLALMAPAAHSPKVVITQAAMVHLINMANTKMPERVTITRNTGDRDKSLLKRAYPFMEILLAFRAK
jgi:hypothetical protein